MNNLFDIDPQQEIEKIVSFLQKTFQEQYKTHVVLGLSGGIDSATSLFLITKVLPLENIHIIYMPYFSSDTSPIRHIVTAAKIPITQLHIISIKASVDAMKKTLAINEKETVRLGNIMARMRMITLFDFAKKLDALVCGTENKSEYHLAYFTRFGDEASDIEPIQHLYKTQVSAVATSLGVPQFVLTSKPTAGLWPDQSDEAEFGFTYKQADHIMYRYFDQNESLEKITQDFPMAEKVIAWCEKNSYKHNVPYILDSETSSE